MSQKKFLVVFFLLHLPAISPVSGKVMEIPAKPFETEAEHLSKRNAVSIQNGKCSQNVFISKKILLVFPGGKHQIVFRERVDNQMLEFKLRKKMSEFHKIRSNPSNPFSSGNELLEQFDVFRP